jgi:ribokinase
MAMRTPRVPRRGENFHAHSFKMGAGGKGGNAAAAIVRLGGQALMVGCVGDDHLGHFELEALQAEGVDTSGVAPVPDQNTAVAFIMVDDGGENTVLAVNTTNDALTGPMVEATLHPHRGRLDALLVNFEASAEAVDSAIRWGAQQQIPVLVDPAPVRHYSAEVWQTATLLCPNLYEAGEMVGYPVTDRASALQAAQDLLAAGPQVIALKMGSEGALLVTGENHWQIPAYPVQVVDTTGAGDAFSAGLTLALAEGKLLLEAAQFAAAAGAVAVTRFGTLDAMPHRAEVEALFHQ